MDLGQLQEAFGLQGRLTGVGLQLHPGQREELSALQDRYNAEAELQAVSLSGVMQALRLAMTNLNGLVRLLTALLALMGAGLVLNTTLLKTLAERKRMFVLGAIGFPVRFIVSAALIENIVLISAGLVGGLLATLVFGEVVATYLVRHLPYVPPGDLVQLSPVHALRLLGAGLALGVAATLPPLMSLHNSASSEALQDD
jgi:ABC-type antimicrobial peptide transport system permease subunit